MFKRFFLAGFACLLAACSTDGPQKPLDNMASALDSKNVSEFMAQMDLQAYTRNWISEAMRSDPALNALNEVGDFFGVQMDSLVGNLMDMREDVVELFANGITSGQLVAKCRTAITPDCPWTPSSLREGVIIETGPGSAIVKITTTAGVVSWLALSRINGKWLVVGQTALEFRARKMAAASATPEPAPIPQKKREKGPFGI